jgi:hypothetical protein
VRVCLQETPMAPFMVQEKIAGVIGRATRPREKSEKVGCLSFWFLLSSRNASSNPTSTNSHLAIALGPEENVGINFALMQYG